MPVKGRKQVNQNVKALLAKITGPVTEQTVTAVLITGQAYAAAITPRDTSFLVNTQYRRIEKKPGKTIGMSGYGADYALYVNDAPGTLKGKPRSGVKSFETKNGKTGFASNSGNFWDPHAEPDFLKKGFQRDGLSEIKNLIRDGYKL